MGRDDIGLKRFEMEDNKVVLYFDEVNFKLFH